MMKHFIQLLFLLITLSWVSGALAVTGWWGDSKLLAADGAANDISSFGSSVSLSGDRVIMGAGGSAYVFEYDGANWVQTAKLLAADGEPYDGFGASVSLSGDRVVVSAIYDGDRGSNSGSAYVFDYDGTNWVQTAKLLAADGAAGDWFGDSVSLSGDRVVVGTANHDGLGINSGSAYVFDYDGTNWVQTAKLLAADGSPYDRFGYSVSLSGDRVVVGALEDYDPGDYYPAPVSGSAYVFDYDGTNWVQTAKLLAADGAASDRFGYSVSLSGDRVVVGATTDDGLRVVSGSAYVFDHVGTNWVQTAKLLAADGAAGDWFGRSISLSGDRVVVGADEDDDFRADSGSAYVFEYDGANWIQTAKLLAPDADWSDWFGLSVSLSGDRVVVGAINDDDLGSNSGSAYVFRALDVIDPLPDVKVNGADGPLMLNATTQDITLSGRLLAGEFVGDADYWLFAETPAGTYYYVGETGRWVRDTVPASQGPVEDVLVQAFKQLFIRPILPEGTYLIKGGVDLTPNGVLDEPMYIDSLELTIKYPAEFLN